MMISTSTRARAETIMLLYVTWMEGLEEEVFVLVWLAGYGL
jgi:hypothetical protein